EAGAVEPGDRVADLEASSLNGDRKPVPRPRTAERRQVPAGLQHSQALTRPPLTGRERVPLLAHESEAVGRIGHDSINAVIGHVCHDLEAVSLPNVNAH